MPLKWGVWNSATCDLSLSLSFQVVFSSNQDLFLALFITRRDETTKGKGKKGREGASVRRTVVVVVCAIRRNILAPALEDVFTLDYNLLTDI